MEIIKPVVCNEVLRIANVDFSFLHHATEIEYVRRLRNVLPTDSSCGSEMVELSQCHLPPLFSFNYLIQVVDTCGQD